MFYGKGKAVNFQAMQSGELSATGHADTQNTVNRFQKDRLTKEKPVND